MEAQNSTKKVIDFRIYKEDNNLDKKDNLNEIPAKNAVYAILGRINGKPSNCRYVGITNNLQEAIKTHFSLNEKDECLREFMQSIKIKTLNYQLMEDFTEEELNNALKEWEKEYKPECNEELNKVY